MDKETVTELIKAREFKPSEKEMTLTREHAIAFGGDDVTIRIEYKPETYRLTEDAFYPLAEGRKFYEFGKDHGVEDLVSVLYWSLVDTLYPAHSYLDEPWDALPLVVEATYNDEDHSAFRASLGTYH